MIVYADVLVVLNLIVDYFLISATGKILKKKSKAIRLVLSSLIGGVSSLYIFSPKSTVIVELAVRLIVCLLMTFTVWGFKNLKEFTKSVFLLFVVTCSYGGIMYALYKIFSPRGMAVINSVVYFNISPLSLIGFTGITYILFIIFSYIFKREAVTSKRCKIIVKAENREVKLNAICDSGNSLIDIFGKSDIIIADKSEVKKLFINTDISKNHHISSRYRLVPCNTVSGSEVLEGFRCDSGKVFTGDKTILLDSPILAISKTPLNTDYNAIINPEIIE